jgi:hypothetical protein
LQVRRATRRQYLGRESSAILLINKHQCQQPVEIGE